MRIRVAIRDKVGSNFEIKEVKRISGLSKKDMYALAKQCEIIIRETIMSKSKHPSGNLASGFYAHSILNGYAVGDIDELDKMLPYWNHQDKGSKGINANWEHFLPKGLWLDGRWVKSNTGFSHVKPKTPIPALNYIAETLQQMEIHVPMILKRNNSRTIVK